MMIQLFHYTIVILNLDSYAHYISRQLGISSTDAVTRAIKEACEKYKHPNEMDYICLACFHGFHYDITPVRVNGKYI